MNLETRLNILHSSEAISNCTQKTMLNVISFFKNDYSIILTEENGSMLITHLSMAVTRIKNNEPVKEIYEDVFQEALDSEYFLEANNIYKDLEKVLDVELPESEKKYMIVNICVLLDLIK